MLVSLGHSKAYFLYNSLCIHNAILPWYHIIFLLCQFWATANYMSQVIFHISTFFIVLSMLHFIDMVHKACSGATRMNFSPFLKIYVLTTLKIFSQFHSLFVGKTLHKILSFQLMIFFFFISPYLENFTIVTDHLLTWCSL